MGGERIFPLRKYLEIVGIVSDEGKFVRIYFVWFVILLNFVPKRVCGSGHIEYIKKED